MSMNTSATSTNTKDSDVIWVTAEVGNVLVNPLQGISLVNDTVISDRLYAAIDFCRQICGSRKAESAKSVVHLN
jgi:hypothetical protein